MSFVAVGTVGLGIGGSLLSAGAQNRAAGEAADAQVQAAQLGVDEQRRQFDLIRQNFAPYLDAGENSLSSLLALTGASGAQAYQDEIDLIRSSPEYTSLIQDGEEALLANASATGGLRGGNTQGALGQLRPQILSNLINQRYSRLGGITQLGQSSAANQASAGLQTGSNIANLFGQSGAAQAGAALSVGQNNANAIGGITGLVTGGLQGVF